MAMKASAIQVNSHGRDEAWRDAMAAAPRAVMPMATPPQPGTAVKDAARSMVSRMKRRLSRAWSSMGDRRGAGAICSGSAMEEG